MKPQITNSAAPAHTSHITWISSLVGLMLLTCLSPTLYAQNEAIPITSCQDINGPGSFVLVRDLVETQANMACLRIHDTHNVSLNCNSHTVTGSTGYPAPAVSVTNVQNFAITHCTMRIPGTGLSF